jgi:hypothetical protein
MKKPKDVTAEKDATAEVECKACGGTGYPARPSLPVEG